MKPSTWQRLQGLRAETQAAGERMDGMRDRFDRLASRHEDGTAPQAVSAYQLFQTPVDLASSLVALLQLKAGARVLEPSAGLGRILDALRPFGPSEVVAVESSPECAGVLYRQEREGVRLLQKDFLALSPFDIGTFDAVAMNPPFHMRSDIKHTLHALSFLSPGGVLAGLCMDTEHRARILKPMSSSWQQIPAGTFRAEGTNVPTILFTISV